MHRALALALACCLLVACNRPAGDAHAPSGATVAHAAAGASKASVPDAAVSRDESRPPADSDATASSASSASGGTDAALPKDAFVLPGAIDADTGLADLRRIYGAANIREGDLPGGGDETVRGVILFPGDPKRRAYVYFQDARAMTGLSMVGVLDRDSLWRSAQGVRIGMPLPELVALNGKPFEFFGFEGVYGGWISDWLDGRLASIGDGMSLRVRLSHRVFPKDVSYRDLPYENFRSFRSDQPQLARMQVVVDEITLNMPGEDDR
ncbi:MAG TPA: hypothetical protein VK753_08855 [Xanthomonadaceae bacterium]|jgi:hypothetical protein|nr:hypothetical protein [Xanthomonadaceae bacterium]